VCIRGLIDESDSIELNEGFRFRESLLYRQKYQRGDLSQIKAI